MNRLSLIVLACGAVALLLSGCGGHRSGTTLPAAQSSAIVFVSTRDGNNEIYRMDADGSNQTRLTNSPENDLFPRLSRNGKTIVFSRLNAQQSAQIFKMNADGTGVTQLTRNVGQLECLNGDAAISPNGQTIAWTRARGTGTTNIWLMDASGQNQRQLTTDTSHTPSFSPDGTLLVYAGLRNGQPSLIVRTLTSGTERVIVPKVLDSPVWPRFSPDGRLIVFSSSDPVGGGIHVIKADGSNANTPILVATKNHSLDTASFSPSGGSIVFSEEILNTSKYQVVSVDVNTFGNKKILTSSGENRLSAFAG